MIYIANFKTNYTRITTKAYLNALENKLTTTDDEVYLFPPFTALQKHDGKVVLGVQNGYPTQNGAFTGEIGLEQLEEFNIKTILIGHSERRVLDTQELINKKFDFFASHKFKIVYCIGEPLEVREKGIDEVIEYLLNQLKEIDLNYENLLIAYEPIWAIGTGESATMEDIQNVHNILKEKIDKPILYGGSVNAQNIHLISKINSVDGVLVGSASLSVEQFLKIID